MFADGSTTLVPKHWKIDTETLSQFFVLYKDAVTARKEAPMRSIFSDWVRDRLLNRRKVDRKLRKGFRFHHEISMDPSSTLDQSSVKEPRHVAVKWSS